MVVPKIFFLLPVFPFPSLHILHMQLCALSVLGICDKEISASRYATKDWCQKALLTDEEREKVEFKPLCKNHSNRPGDLRHQFETPPGKVLKSDDTPCHEEGTGEGGHPIPRQLGVPGLDPHCEAQQTRAPQLCPGQAG